MKAEILNKSIIVFNSLSPDQINELVTVLKKLMDYYKTIISTSNIYTSIPIKLKNPNSFLLIYSKNGTTYLSVTKPPTGKFAFSPIINGDDLYDSIGYLKNEAYKYVHTYVQTSQKIPHSEWIKLPINRAIDSYLLSPNMNPADFVQSLQTGDLPNMYRQFLENVGISLDKYNQDLLKEEYSKD